LAGEVNRRGRVEPRHDFRDTCPGFEVLENGGNRHTRILKHPRAADLALARKQAAEKGLPYQTYIKSLLHETLAERERRKAG
jgi:hypothetical protein